MADTHRDRRLNDATTLHELVESLTPVDPTKRMALIHDQLMAAIDDSCKTHTASRASGFNAPQLAIIKDIAFQIVYVLHPLNKTQPKGFFRSLWAEWKQKSPMTKIGIVIGVIVFLATSISGIYHFGSDAWSWWNAKQAQESAKPAPKPDGNKSASPSTATQSPTPAPSPPAPTPHIGPLTIPPGIFRQIPQ
jgi:hypothetical protein